jgi:hypothetical protein
MQIKPKVRTHEIIISELENELLIYDLNINKALCLNQTSAMVYQNCDGSKTVAEISSLMSRKLQSEVSEDFVWLALNELRKENLLENSDDFANHFQGLTRREVVKKVGLATMIALPIVSSVVAPKAAAAQSVNVGDPFCLTCPADLPTTCLEEGNYLLGCFQTSTDCETALLAQNGGIGVPSAYCCGGLDTPIWRASDGCCIASCRLDIDF